MNAPHRAAVAGWPIAHSRSPELFAAFAAAANVRLEYRRLAVPPGAFAAALAARDPADVGWNVTLPHKGAALAAADHATDRARRLGAANVLTFTADGVLADSTDGDGVRATLAHAACDVRGAHALVLGAGGAARAVVDALAAAGASTIAVANRDLRKAQRLCDDLAPLAGACVVTCATDAVADAANARLIVDATSRVRGGKGAVFDDDAIVRASARDALVFDLTYGMQTPFLDAAICAGRRAIDGTVMLEAQAAATFRRWFPAAVLA